MVVNIVYSCFSWFVVGHLEPNGGFSACTFCFSALAMISRQDSSTWSYPRFKNPQYQLLRSKTPRGSNKNFQIVLFFQPKVINLPKLLIVFRRKTSQNVFVQLVWPLLEFSANSWPSARVPDWRRPKAAKPRVGNGKDN